MVGLGLPIYYSYRFLRFIPPITGKLVQCVATLLNYRIVMNDNYIDILFKIVSFDLADKVLLDITSSL